MVLVSVVFEISYRTTDRQTHSQTPLETPPRHYTVNVGNYEFTVVIDDVVLTNDDDDDLNLPDCSRVREK